MARISWLEANYIDKHKLQLAENKIRDMELRIEYEHSVQQRHETEMARMQVSELITFTITQRKRILQTRVEELTGETEAAVTARDESATNIERLKLDLEVVLSRSLFPGNRISSSVNKTT